MLQDKANQLQIAFIHFWQCIQTGLRFPKVSQESIETFGNSSPEQCLSEDRKNMFELYYNDQVEIVAYST